METPAAAADESPADKVRKLLAGKVDDAVIDEVCALCAAPAADEEPGKPAPDTVKKEDVAAAMDSMRQEFREANEARVDVRSVL